MPSLPPPASESAPSPYCDTCRAATGTKRYCAPGRCYCGHEVCPAFDSYIDMSKVPLPEVGKSKRRRGTKSWDERGEATWIDSL